MGVCLLVFSSSRFLILCWCELKKVNEASTIIPRPNMTPKPSNWQNNMGSNFVLKNSLAKRDDAIGIDKNKITSASFDK